MKSIRRQPIFRVLTVALMLVSWLVVTNHCALGMMKTPVAGEEHAHCHSGKTPAGKDAPNGLRECCKTVNGAPLPTKAEVKFDASKVQVEVVALLSALDCLPVEPALSALIHDHGPPRFGSFAELVLQHSLLSHAPPLAA